MNEEERKQKEEALKELIRAADSAHAAAAEDPEDDDLKKAAETAEEAVTNARKELDGAPPAEDEDEEEEEEGEVIDFEKELAELPPGGEPASRSELEKAERALHFNAKRVTELGGDPSKIVQPKGPVIPPAEDDGKFVTKDDLYTRDLKSEIAKLGKTEAERRVILWRAQNSIRPSGDPVEDAQNAYMIAHKGKISRSFY